LGNITWGLVSKIPTLRLPFVIRLAMVLKIAEMFNEDFGEKINKKIEKLKEGFKKSTICEKVCEEAIISFSNDSISSFLEDIRSLFRIITPKNLRKAIYFDYLYTLGSDLGEVIYKRDVRRLMSVLDELSFFGWIWGNKNDEETLRKYGIYTLFNLLINWINLERFKNAQSIENSKDFINKLCFNVETAKIYRYMKMIKWEMKLYERAK